MVESPPRARDRREGWGGLEVSSNLAALGGKEREGLGCSWSPGDLTATKRCVCFSIHPTGRGTGGEHRRGLGVSLNPRCARDGKKERGLGAQDVSRRSGDPGFLSIHPQGG